MKTKASKGSEEDIETEIEELEVQIAELRLNLAKKERKKAQLIREKREKRKDQEKELNTEERKGQRLGTDKYKRPVHIGDRVRLHTFSKPGPFRGETHAIVMGYSGRHTKRVLIGKIGQTSVTTNREFHNVSVEQE